MTNISTEPAVYVGTFWKYNNGSLEGKWMNPGDYDDLDDFMEACRELHKDEKDPEIMFQDYEGFPEVYYSEGGLHRDLWDYIELDTYQREIVMAFYSAYSYTDPEEVSHILDHYVGNYGSMEDFAREQADDSCRKEWDSLPSWISDAIDWGRAGELLAMDMTWDQSSGHLFYD